MRKLGSRICNCGFIGYACNSSYYRFLVFKIDVLDYNIFIESENVILFEHVFHLKNKKKSYHGSLLLLINSLMMCKS
jgi:hypothetical protein